MNACSLFIRNSLCHGFNALCDKRNGCAPKSRLLIFAASLGNHLKQENVEKGLPEHRSTDYLKFHEFLFYLDQELFLSLPKDLTPSLLQKLQYDVDDFCWLVCKHEFFSQEASEHLEEYYFYLFRVFCALSDFCEQSDRCSIILNAEEVQFVVESFDKLLGNDIEVSVKSRAFKNCEFGDFIKVIEENLIQCDKIAVVEAMKELYEIYVENVIKKGSLKKLLTPIGPWWEMWFVLKQHSLTWFSSRTKKESWGEISLHNSKIHIESGTGMQFSLISDTKATIFSAMDCASKLQWIAAFGVALKHCDSLEPFQQICAEKRHQMRLEKASRKEEEKQNLLMKEKALELEKNNKLQIELILHKETEKVKDLQVQERLLMSQLEEERQAKRDEEIVRNLQSRLLAEEWEKRENLEKEQYEKELQLSEEREKRHELELRQQEKEAEIDHLANVVSTLEKERETLSSTLKRTKTMLTEVSSPVKMKSNKGSHPILKRSISTDLSHIQSAKWSLSTDVNDEGDVC